MRLRNSSFVLLTSFLLGSCARELSECSGPRLNTSNVLSAQSLLSSTGPIAYLVLPNPVDATNKLFIEQSDSSLKQVEKQTGLAGLLSPTRLENEFLKIRSRTLKDDLPYELASPNSLGLFKFELTDQRYSQTLAYHSIQSVMGYVRALGFSVNQEKPLYVMVRSNDDPTDPQSQADQSLVNAYYVHNKYSPSLPRYIQLFGETKYPLSNDRDTYWHEFGHLFNESVTADVGFDEATISGASFVESRALHECLADYLDESLSNKGYIGKWGARNFSSIPAGNPLRSATFRKDEKNNFGNIGTYNAEKNYPENYSMAEWCTRVLWDIRSQFQKEDPNTGAVFSDRLIFSALSLLEQDASIRDFAKALRKVDETFHCGLHSRSIRNAFESRGFTLSPELLSKPLVFSARAVGANASAQGFVMGQASGQSTEVFFSLQITNPNSAIARNVRVKIESQDPAVIPLVYLQGYGDLAPGKTISVGGNQLENFLNSVSLTTDSRFSGTRRPVTFQLKVLVDNGPASIQNLGLNL